MDPLTWSLIGAGGRFFLLSHDPHQFTQTKLRKRQWRGSQLGLGCMLASLCIKGWWQDDGMEASAAGGSLHNHRNVYFIKRKGEMCVCGGSLPGTHWSRWHVSLVSTGGVWAPEGHGCHDSKAPHWMMSHRTNTHTDTCGLTTPPLEIVKG